MDEPGGDREWDRGGRTLRWRLLVSAIGLALAGAGAAVLFEPRIIVWVIASVLIALGAGCVLSAVLARGRDA